MTVVVTGAAGFIGRHLVAALSAQGHPVVGIDRRPDIAPGAAVALVADLCDDNPDVAAALHNADAVFHLAAFPGVRDDGVDADARRRRDNVDATRCVLAAVPLDVPLVVTSSSSVYGGSDGDASRETDTPRPLGAYAESKLDAERLCAKRVSRGGLVAVARPFTVAGEGQRPDMAISRWLAAASTGEPLRILGSPLRTRDVTDVRHVVEGLIRMADRGVRSTVNLGTGRAVTLQAMAQAVADAVGVQLSMVQAPAGRQEPPATLADTRRCQSLLGFVPTTDIRDLVARQLAATRLLEVA